MKQKNYFDITGWLDDHEIWGIWIDRNQIDGKINPRNYVRKPGSPSALRRARLLAKIAESEAKS